MKKIVLIGDPIDHSLSPDMHNAAFKELNIDNEFQYSKLYVKADELDIFVKRIRSKEFFGANVTTPYKSKVIRFLDELTTDAENAGAVNTIFIKNEKIVGHSTDGLGCINALKENNIEVHGKKILILGAGGAARAISYKIAFENPKELIILNRTKWKAEELVKTIIEKMKINIKAEGISNINDELKYTDILINCTSVGMREVNENIKLPLSSENLDSQMIVMDIVYNPLKTGILKEAEKAGCKTINGLSMLVHQGAIGFKLWTGEIPPLKLMKEAVRRELE